MAICDVFTAYLKTEGFEVESAHEGETGANLAVSGEFFLILLDIDLPGIDGFEVLSRIRSGSSVPVILMSGTHLEEADRIVGLTAGADDFLCKPFNLAELVARIRAVGRRTHQESPETIVVGDVELNTGTRTTTCADKQVKLTSAEFRLLEVFVRSAGSVLNREQLEQEVLHRTPSRFTRAIDTHVSNLRRKLGPHPDGTERIKSIRDVGYIYTHPGQL